LQTDAAAKPVPLNSHMAEDLLRWRRQSAYSRGEDYVFASKKIMRGKRPYWPRNLMKRHIRPMRKQTAFTNESAGIPPSQLWHVAQGE
jgi:hypothetical protein